MALSSMISIGLISLAVGSVATGSLLLQRDGKEIDVASAQSMALPSPCAPVDVAQGSEPGSSSAHLNCYASFAANSQYASWGAVFSASAR